MAPDPSPAPGKRGRPALVAAKDGAQAPLLALPEGEPGAGPEAFVRGRVVVVASLSGHASDEAAPAAARRDAVRLARQALDHAWGAFRAWRSDIDFAEAGDTCSSAGRSLDELDDALWAAEARLRGLEQRISASPRLAKTKPGKPESRRSGAVRLSPTSPR